MSMTFRKEYEAPEIVSLTIQNIARDSITLQISTDTSGSSDGNIHCGAFDASEAVIPSVREDILIQNYVATTSGYQAILAMTNLNPATTYTIYCISYHEIGIPSELALMVNTNITTTTQCCRELVVDFVPVITNAFHYLDWLKIDTDTPPESDLYLNISIISTTDRRMLTVPRLDVYSHNSDVLSSSGISTTTEQIRQRQRRLSESTSIIVPSTHHIYGGVNMRERTSSLGRMPKGDYSLTVSLEGIDSSKYTIIYANGDGITVNGPEVAVAGPVITLAQFSDDGTYVNILLSFESDEAYLPTAFVCSEILEFENADTSQCVWQSGASIAVFSNFYSTLLPGHTITLLPDKLKAACTDPRGACDGWTYSPTQVVTVVSPDKPISPYVSLSGPTKIPHCSSISLNHFSSEGSAGGRSWTTFNVSVISSNSTENLLPMSSYLKQYKNQLETIAIPNEYLVAGNMYTVTLTLCNIFSKCSSGVHVVTMVKSEIPMVSIRGNALRRYTKTNKKLSLSADSIVGDCSSSGKPSEVFRQWVVTSQGRVVTINDRARDPNKLSIAAYTLTVGQVYEMTFTTLNLATFRSSSAAVSVFVEPGELVAVVKGGADRNIIELATILLDASPSYDEDLFGLTGVAAGLTFEWSCVQVDPVDDDCPFILPNAQTRGWASETLLLQAPAIEQPILTLVTLTISNSDGRTDQTSVALNILNVTQPLVDLNINYEGVVSTARKVAITGDVILQGSALVSWSVDDSLIDLSAISMVPITSDMKRSKTIKLVLAPHTLPVDRKLTFTLTCVQAAYMQGNVTHGTMISATRGSASITVITNSPPTPGIFYLSPTEGVSLSDYFVFNSALWYDTELPITYQYSFKTSRGSNVVLKRRSEESSISKQLPMGDSRYNYQVECFASIFDSLDANTTVSSPVKVVGEGGAAAVSSVFSAMNASLDTLSEDEIESLASVASALLNAVNCTLAPNCTSLNRYDCSGVDHTCGGCLSEAFIGEDGSSNQPCFNISQYASSDNGDADLLFRDRRKDRYRHNRRLQGSTCSVDLDCPVYQQCMSGLCILDQKACPANCTDNGACYYIHAVTSERLPDNYECYVDDTNCLAMCSCYTGFAGRTCSMSSAEMTTRQDTRDLIITSVSSLASTTTELEDMQSVLSIGVEATSRTEELTYNSSVQSLDILDMLTTEATTSAFDTSYEDFAPAMQILDYSMTVQENSRREYIASQNASRFAYTTQLIQIFAPSLFDSARRFNGEHVLGSFRLRYNSTTSPSIGAFASATDMKHALETLYLSNGERIEVDVMQSYSAVALEGTIMAVPGSSNLRCVSFTCGFATLPAGEYVRVGDSPDADWYTVYHTHDASDSKFLSLGLESDYRTRASYTGASSTTNTTLYRWGRGNGWKITFVGNTSVTNPTSIQMLENDGDDNELSPASATVSIVAMSILALANDTGIVKTDRLMSSIRSIASLATADMVDGQEAFESVTNSFRLTRSMISSSDGTSNASALTIPKTQQEKSLDAMDASSGSTTGTTPEVYIPMGETGSDGIAEEVTISVMKISSSLLELDGDVKSDIISIDMSALPTSFDSSSSTELNITIPNTQALDFSYEAMPSVLTHCFFDDYSAHEYACPSNAAQTSLTVYCNGTEGVLENRCSSLRPTPSCDAVDGSSVSSAHCRVIAFDESSTTCACQMASDVRRRNRRLRARRLQTDDDASSSDE
jgi:hypothetical protein